MTLKPALLAATACALLLSACAALPRAEPSSGSAIVSLGATAPPTRDARNSSRYPASPRLHLRVRNQHLAASLSPAYLQSPLAPLARRRKPETPANAGCIHSLVFVSVTAAALTPDAASFVTVPPPFHPAAVLREFRGYIGGARTIGRHF